MAVAEVRRDPQINNSSNTKDIICLVNGWMGTKGMVFEHGGTNGRHKTRNGWYLGLVAPISSIVRLLILYG